MDQGPSEQSALVAPLYHIVTHVPEVGWLSSRHVDVVAEVRPAQSKLVCQSFHRGSGNSTAKEISLEVYHMPSPILEMQVQQAAHNL
jgi:hypothetical protein